MKNKAKIAVIFLLAALLLLPFQSAQAKGLSDGPVVGGNYTLKSGDTLNQDLVVFGGSVSIEKDATVNGAVVLLGGSLTLDGEVTRDVVVVAGAAKLGSTAHVHGNLVTVGVAVNRDPGAKVDGDVITNPTKPGTPAVPPIPNVPGVNVDTGHPILSALSVIAQSIILALLAALIAMFLPNHMRRVADAVVTQPLVSFGMGLLTLVGFIVAIVALAVFSILIITLLVTVPLIVIVSIIFTAAAMLGWLALGLEVGVRISGMFKSEWPMALSAGVGVFVLNLVAQSVGFVPCIGGVIAGILWLAGLGGVFMTRFGIRPATLSLPPVIDANPPAQPG